MTVSICPKSKWNNELYMLVILLYSFVTRVYETRPIHVILLIISFPCTTDSFAFSIGNYTGEQNAQTRKMADMF